MDLSSVSPMPPSIAGPVDFEIDEIHKIRGIIAEYIGVNVKRLIDDADLCDDFGLHWLECLELVLRIEDNTGIEIPESDMTRIENVGDLVRYIQFATKNQKVVAATKMEI